MLHPCFIQFRSCDDLFGRFANYGSVCTPHKFRPLLLGLPRLDHQPEKDQRPGTRYRNTTSHHHRWLWAWCGPSVHVPWLHHHQQLLTGCGDWQENREGSQDPCMPHNTHVDQPQADSEDQNGSVQCLCHQHTAIRQRDVDHVCQARKASEHLPNEKHLPHPGNIVAWQSTQYWSPVLCRSAQHVHTAQTAQTLLARPCPPHARGPHPQRWSPYGELASGKRPTRRPQLQYHDVVKRDMKAVDINTESWESLAANWSKWRETLTNHFKAGEEKLTQAATERQASRKLSGSSDRPETEHKCNLCNRDCHSASIGTDAGFPAK